MNKKHKILTILILGVTFVSSAFGVLYLTPSDFDSIATEEMVQVTETESSRESRQQLIELLQDESIQ